jgi:flavin-dependent dehydrogenase
MQAVDIAVIGGGTAGLVAARELALAGASVVVVDGTRARMILGEGLPPAATPLLQRLGLWDRFVADQHVVSFGNVSIWGTDRREQIDFIRSPYGRGWHLDRGRFDAMLLHAACEAGVVNLPSARAVACTRSGSTQWEITLKSGSTPWTIRAGFLVDATGRARWVARSQGVRRLAYDRLVGVIGHFAPADGTANTDARTLVEAAPDGWWYSTPCPGGELVVGYMTDADLVGRARTFPGWNALLADTCNTRKQVQRRDMRLIGPLRVVCSDSSCLLQIAGEGWCAVGDAAAAYDPLSSQGLLMAVQSGIQAARLHCSTAPRRHHAYEDWVRQCYVEYLVQWLAYYSLEQRWCDHPFWHRRHMGMEPARSSAGA